jgi:hypothetical protein
VFEKYLKTLIERRDELQEAVFTHPPSNWDEFQKRLGRWIELNFLIDDISGKMKDEDNG